jgi:hypothetical protein
MIAMLLWKSLFSLLFLIQPIGSPYFLLCIVHIVVVVVSRDLFLFVSSLIPFPKALMDSHGHAYPSRSLSYTEAKLIIIYVFNQNFYMIAIKNRLFILIKFCQILTWGFGFLTLDLDIVVVTLT